jgi:hypothetical protein
MDEAYAKSDNEWSLGKKMLKEIACFYFSIHRDICLTST